jgi:AraC family transcriptional activator of pobA
VKKGLTVLKISDFDRLAAEKGFYISALDNHVKNHSITRLPHKHDFYFVVLITAGRGEHEIDFEKYPVTAGALFTMGPGQMHRWKFTPDVRGIVFFHSREFYDKGFTGAGIREFSFFNSSQSNPLFLPKQNQYQKIKALCGEMEKEYKEHQPSWDQKIRSMLNIVYIELSRMRVQKRGRLNLRYLAVMRHFEDLINENFKQLHSAGEYALKLNISEKHLNRITRSTLDKTSTELIAERIILEAKRMLIQGELNITEIAEELGFEENGYFARFFKKHAGKSPRDFAAGYRNGMRL